MAKILLKPQAETDLVEIWVYIAQDNPTAADELLNIIDDKCITLSESPLIGKARDELVPGVRSFPVGNYVLFYQLIENGEDGIEIIRVLHGARDIDSLFE